MKKLQVVIALVLSSFLFQAFTVAKTVAPNEIIGLYWSPKKDAKIEIYQKGNQYFGKSVWVVTQRKDIKNPKESLRSRDVLGIELLTGFSYEKGIYAGGEIYDPESGKTYDCKMSLEGNKLKVRGYIGISLFGRTEYFERIK